MELSQCTAIMVVSPVGGVRRTLGASGTVEECMTDCQTVINYVGKEQSSSVDTRVGERPLSLPSVYDCRHFRSML